MSAGFKLGEVCVGQNFVHTVKRNGQECEIITSLAIRDYRDAATKEVRLGSVYYVRWSDGSEHAAHPHQLRKKHPPRSAKSIMREVIAKAKQPSKVSA